MESQQGHEPRVGALEDLARGLGDQAQEFTPAQRGPGTDGAGLPGRQRGENFPEQPAAVREAATIIIDCGTSRRSGYSHVLWVSPSASAMLGANGLESLSDAIAELPGVSAYEWDGLDLMHLRAAGSDWGYLLEAARDAVDALLAAR